MAITPGPGYMIDPNNPNGVIPIGSASTVNNPNANLISGSTAPAPYVPPSTYGAVTQNPAPAPVVQTGTATLANGQVATQYSDGTWKSNGTALSGSLLQEAQTKVSAQNAAPTQNIYEANPYWVRPSTTHAGPETTAEYNDRVAKMNPNLPAPQTTSSTGVTNTAKPALGATGYSGITSAMLTSGSQSQTQYTPNPTLPNTASTIGAATLAGTTGSMGPEHDKYQTISDSLQSDETALAGESQFTADQYSQKGVNTAANQINDYSSKLAILQQQGAAIQLEQQGGEGVTSAIDQRQRQEKMRLNSIEQSKTAADLNLARGNYATAKMAADDAIEKQFGPIKASIAAKIANLEIISKSPNFTAEEQKRADALKASNAAQDAAVDAQIDNHKQIWTIYSNAYQIAAQSGKVDSVVLESIKNATTKEEALRLAGNAGLLTAKNVPASAQEYEYAKAHGYTGTYEQYQNEDANRKAKIAAAGIAGNLTPTQVTASFKLADDYDKASGTFSTQVDAYNRIVSSSSNPTAAGDLSLIFAYMKMLDPTSVVREGEFATAANAGSAFQRVGAQYNKVLNGERLTTAQRSDFLSTANGLYSVAKKQQDQVDATYTARAGQYGIPASFVVRDRSSVSSSADTQGTNATVQSNGQTWIVGQVYNDGTANWTVDANGKWTKQ